MKNGNPRDVTFHCSLCDVDNTVQVPFGAFVEQTPGVFCSILEERAGQSDRLISDVWCSKCGCTKYLTIVEKPVETIESAKEESHA